MSRTSRVKRHKPGSTRSAKISDVRRWIPFVFVSALAVSATGAALASARTAKTAPESTIAADLAAKTVSLEDLPSGWSDVAGLGILVESRVPAIIRRLVPSEALYGPVVVARQFRLRRFNETVEETLGLTPSGYKADLRTRILSLQRRAITNVLIKYIYANIATQYVRPPFAMAFAWTGYYPSRPIKVPVVAPGELVWSSGTKFGPVRSYSYFFLSHGVLLRVESFGSASPAIVQAVVERMVAKS